MPFSVASWEVLEQQVKRGSQRWSVEHSEEMLAHYFWRSVSVSCQHCTERQEAVYQYQHKAMLTTIVGVTFGKCRRCDREVEDGKWIEAVTGAYRLHGFAGIKSLLEGE